MSAQRMLAFIVLAAACATSAAAARSNYPTMAPLQQYLSASLADEISLARSAAPPAIAKHANVLALGPHGYRVAVQGSNGFVCVVERGWANQFNDPGFWNPRIRGPFCFNADAARSVLPDYLTRTQWVLAGATRTQMLERTKAAVASGKITAPATGSMCYMLSKRGYLGDAAGGPWHPHLMFFLPPTQPAQWGANEERSPVMAATDRVEPVTIFLVPVRAWSDGTPDTAGVM